MELTKLPSNEEIYINLMKFEAHSSPGPDGFRAHFYQKCWPIIHSDVAEAVCDFFKGAQLPRSYTCTN